MKTAKKHTVLTIKIKVDDALLYEHDAYIAQRDGPARHVLDKPVGKPCDAAAILTRADLIPQFSATFRNCDFMILTGAVISVEQHEDAVSVEHGVKL